MFGWQDQQQGQGAPFFAQTIPDPEPYRKPEPTQPKVDFGYGHPGALLPSNLEGVFRLAQYIHRSGMAPKDFDTVERIFVAVMMGMELGMKPMQSVQNIAVVNGRPSVWGDMLIAQVMASGFMESLPDEHFEGNFPDDDFQAVCTVKRKGEKPVTREFSIADAKRAKLWTKEKTPWITYPKRMLQMRARSWALRDVFADVLQGLRIAEEERDGGQFSDLINDMIESTPARPAEDDRAVEEDLTWRLVQSVGLNELPVGFNAFVGQSADNLGLTTLGLLKQVTRRNEEMTVFWKTYNDWISRQQARPDPAPKAEPETKPGSDPEPKTSSAPEPVMSDVKQHEMITERCKILDLNRTDILREYSGQGTLKNLTADQAQEIIDGLGDRLDLLEAENANTKANDSPGQGSLIGDDQEPDEKELAAMRRELVKRGEALGRDVDAESRERFGVPSFKLSRDQVEKWFAVLEEQSAQQKDDPPPAPSDPGKQTKDQARAAFHEACKETGAHPFKVLEHVFPKKDEGRMTLEDWNVALACCFLPSDYFQHAVTLFEDGVYRAAKLAHQYGVTDFKTADDFILAMKRSKKLDDLLAGVK